MTATTTPYTFTHNPTHQEVAVAGEVRPEGESDCEALWAGFTRAALASKGTLYVDLKRLKLLSSAGLLRLVKLLEDISAQRPDLAFKLVTTSVVPAARERLALCTAHLSNVQVEQYDDDFYQSQDFVETSERIPILRAQTRIVWEHEQEVLQRHGLKPGMRVADICCGIGDFAALITRHFAPEKMVAIDHSKPFVAYAIQTAQEMGLQGIEYQYGDAASLLLEDESFDFVTCRLSLQIFDQPVAIVRELCRICKPGGRIYVTTESMSRIHGYPRQDAIHWSYSQLSRMCVEMGMDLEFGPKMVSVLIDAGLDDVQFEMMTLHNRNTSPEGFAEVVSSWKESLVDDLVTATEMGSDEQERLHRGLEDHVNAIRSPRGFGCWPIYVASGLRP